MLVHACIRSYGCGVADYNDQTNPDDHRAALDFIGTHQLYKTLRVLIICATIVWCTSIIMGALVELASKPPWLELMLAIFGPFGVIAYFNYELIRRYIEKAARAVRKSQGSFDPNRTTSGLNPDGTHDRD
jgi:hypothetical protein